MSIMSSSEIMTFRAQILKILLRIYVLHFGLISDIIAGGIVGAGILVVIACIFTIARRYVVQQIFPSCGNKYLQ